MPNWCCNTVEFYADDTVLKEIQKLFQELAKLEMKTMHGQLPEFVTAQSGWLHEIDFEKGLLYYQTKWSPNLDVIKQIAEHFKCGFYYFYDEPGCCIYGEARYENGILTECYLDSDDYDLFELVDEDDTYIFEDKGYESQYDIFEILLERKAEIITIG